MRLGQVEEQGGEQGAELLVGEVGEVAQTPQGLDHLAEGLLIFFLPVEGEGLAAQVEGGVDGLAVGRDIGKILDFDGYLFECHLVDVL